MSRFMTSLAPTSEKTFEETGFAYFRTGGGGACPPLERKPPGKENQSKRLRKSCSTFE